MPLGESPSVYGPRYVFWRLVFLIVSIIAFVLAAALSFGWVKDAGAAKDAIGSIAIGLALFAAAHL